MRRPILFFVLNPSLNSIKAAKAETVTTPILLTGITEALDMPSVLKALIR
jgi:hypothetical protein